MMADVQWPPCLTYSDVAFDLAGLTASGGQALDGSELIVGSPSQRWMARLTLPIHDIGDRVLAFRSLRNNLRGRLNATRVPAGDGRGPAERAGLRLPIPFSDGALLSDRSGFFNPLTKAALLVDGGMNAIELRATLAPGLSFLAGQRFSFPDGRMHEIGQILEWDGGASWRFSVAPWLQADYPAGTALEFDRPVCRMRLASDGSGGLSLRLNRFGTASLDFVGA
jgi:hypothetical protein